jgi:transcriptional regulator with GAF, ATPase, and Fis domain
MVDTELREDSARAPAGAPRSVALLRFMRSTTVGTEIEIDPRGITIGRASGPASRDVGVADPAMSSHHARIALAGGEWVFHDLGSRNGSFIDGIPLPPGSSLTLEHDAVLRLGDTLAVFSVGTKPEEADACAPEFPGVSRLAAHVRRRVRVLAAGTGHVLVLGETGTGKERVARSIGASGREFVPQNCAELSRDLARSELFGHVRGAFSGATHNRTGLVEVAHDGALFLDEVGELALDVQAELLRFLEDGCYRPMGSTELRHSSARVIAATNLDLDEAVSKGTFRRDLLARLRASNRPLELPPLRERREDLYDWSLRFLREALGDEPPPVPWSAGALECLLLYPWPENLRELRGVVRAALEGHPRWPVEPTALPEKLQAHRRARRLLARTEATAVIVDREEIQAILRRVQGNVKAAAAELHVERTRFYRLCEKLGIRIEDFRNGE